MTSTCHRRLIDRWIELLPFFIRSMVWHFKCYTLHGTVYIHTRYSIRILYNEILLLSSCESQTDTHVKSFIAWMINSIICCFFCCRRIKNESANMSGVWKKRLLTLAFEYNVWQSNGAKFHVNNFSTKPSRHSFVRRAPVHRIRCLKFSIILSQDAWVQREDAKYWAKRSRNINWDKIWCRVDAPVFYCFSFELRQYLEFIAFYWHVCTFAPCIQVERALFPSNCHKHYLKF